MQPSELVRTLRLTSTIAVLAGVTGIIGAAGVAAADAALPEADTVVSYHGRVEHRGNPLDGVADFSFALYDQPVGGALLGRLDHFDVPLAAGEFAVELDFGVEQALADSSWLEIRVRSAAEPAGVTLEPRQRFSRSANGSACIVNSDVQIHGELFVAAQQSAPALSIACCNDVDNGGQLLINGFLNALLFDDNEIQANVLNSPGPLSINAAGGNVGIRVANPQAPLNLPGSPDASLGSGGVLVVGSPAGTNLAFDNNEIMARNNGAASTLYVNAEGGNVVIGGSLDVGLQWVETPGSSASCPTGKKVLGGGCWTNSDAPLVISRPISSLTGWLCDWDNSGFITVKTYAICARVN